MAWGKWLRPLGNSNRSGLTTLVCFPYAGAGAGAFASWRSGIPSELNVQVVQYPGRESRWGEPFPDSLQELVATMVREFGQALEPPFALLGHSFGALAAFEFCRHLMAATGKVPERLFVSGARAPHLSIHDPIHALPDEEFSKRLREFNGIPPEVQANRDLLALTLPIARNDFRIFEQHSFQSGELLEVPLTAFGGLNDLHVSHGDLLAWGETTSKSFRSRFLPGDHFFLFAKRDVIIRHILEDLEGVAEPSVSAQSTEREQSRV